MYHSLFSHLISLLVSIFIAIAAASQYNSAKVLIHSFSPRFIAPSCHLSAAIATFDPLRFIDKRGGDFLFDAESIENRWGMVQEAKKQWDDGAVISIMW